ncbi:helix-turn-helix domain-containing protein [Granulicella sp. dw_53]|uniref:helix-turn-helix domain-containing protein n=1 Tax=Granulicella sp. dw_53 TaxID=2719792 RepID=UPI001BD55DE7|nr:helix-turn-helix domain-containing protein [Granulicella sp. dw_53]
MRGSYIHLELSERALIETQLGLGMRPAAIAAGLMRSRSTVASPRSALWSNAPPCSSPWSSWTVAGPM